MRATITPLRSSRMPYVYEIAAGSRYVYVVDRVQRLLNVYLAHRNGPQQPVMVVSIPYQVAYGVLAGR